MSYYRGSHSGIAWIAFVIFCVVLILFEHSFLGVVIGFVGFLGVSFVIYKLIGGDGGLMK